MKILHSTTRSALAVAACLSIVACSSNPPAPQSSEMDYRTRSLPGKATGIGSDSGQRLTIQAGEGEKLNLPWFIKDSQDWVNRQ